MLKQFIAISGFEILLLFLTSCDVHFGDIHYEVPWWGIALPAILADALITIISHRNIVSKTYKCPECGTKFRPRWNEISAWIHIGEERVVKCPHCHRKGFCRPADDYSDS